jgi:hypothetical protein
MTPPPTCLHDVSRRELFQRTGTGLGAIALASLLAEDAPCPAATPAPDDPLRPRPTSFAPKAKNVIFLHLVGAPSHLDLFDSKPELVRLDGRPMPDHLWEGLRLAFIREKPDLLGTRFRFDRHGKSGTELSELLPNLATVADDLCLL